MNETLTPLKQEANTNPVHNLDDMVNWFAVLRDKYPGFDDTARRAREALISVVPHSEQNQKNASKVSIELRPLRPGVDPDSVFYANEPMEEGTYALLSQILRATAAEMIEEQSFYDEETGDSYTVYLAKVAGEEIFITEKRSDNITTLSASAEVPNQPTESRKGSLVIVGQP